MLLSHWIEIIVNERILIVFFFDRPTTILFSLFFQFLSVFLK